MNIKAKAGNLFDRAEAQLKEELDGGKIDDYSMLDIVDRAIYLRKKLDKMRLSKLFTRNELRKIYYSTTGK